MLRLKNLDIFFYYRYTVFDKKRQLGGVLMNKRIKKIFIVFLILYVFFILCSSKTFARTIDTNIDGINDGAYPRN